MHLVLFMSALEGGGAQRRMLLLARGFAEAGHEVRVVTVAAQPGDTADLPAGVDALSLNGSVPRLSWIRHRRALWVPMACGRLARHLRRRPPDALLSTSTPANLTALAARSFAGTETPLVVTLNLDLEGSLGRGAGAVIGLARRVACLYRHADMRIAISRGVADSYRRLLGARLREQAPIVTVPNPVDVAAITVAARETPRPIWPVPGTGPLILACGKLKPQKDFSTLLEAAARIRRERPFRLVILGEGEERSMLERTARRLGIGDRVLLPGFVRNPWAWLARASLFVLSSRFEGSSNVLLEALACGCPVVATDCPSGPRELLANGRFGRLVPVGRPEILAQAIVAALDGMPDRNGLRTRAAEFSIERATVGYLTAIEEARRRRRAMGRMTRGSTDSVKGFR